MWGGHSEARAEAAYWGRVGNETGREGRGWMVKVLECQAKDDKLHPQAMGSH